MLAWHIGMRYLRTRRAAWLAVIAITLTVAVPIVVLAVMQGFVDVTRLQVRANEPDLTVMPRFANEEFIDSPQRREDLKDIPGVAQVAPFVTTYAVVTPVGRHRNIPCQIDAVDWQADWQLGRISPRVLHPSPEMNLSAPPIPPSKRGSGFLTPSWRDYLVLQGMNLFVATPLPMPPLTPPPTGIIVGRELAYNIYLWPGDRVKLLVPNGEGGGRPALVEISDTIGTGIYEIDRYVGILPLPLGQRLADMNAHGDHPAQLSGYRLQLTDRAAGNLVKEQRLVRDATEEQVTTWMENRGNMVKSLEIQRNIIGLVMIAIQIITVFVVYAVFSTLVAEKRHDIGVLLGIGVRRRDVAGAFLMAGLAACVIGGILGWGLGWGFLSVLNPFCRKTGIALFPQDVLYTPEAPISWNPLIPLIFIAIMSAIGLIAVSLPAWRASRIDPIDILREGT